MFSKVSGCLFFCVNGFFSTFSSDIDGLESRRIGGQLLTLFRESADTSTSERLSTSTSAEITLAADAGTTCISWLLVDCIIRFT